LSALFFGSQKNGFPRKMRMAHGEIAGKKVQERQCYSFTSRNAFKDHLGLPPRWDNSPGKVSSSFFSEADVLTSNRCVHGPGLFTVVEIGRYDISINIWDHGGAMWTAHVMHMALTVKNSLYGTCKLDV
jgi:hypothetical protein